MWWHLQGPQKISIVVMWWLFILQYSWILLYQFRWIPPYCRKRVKIFNQSLKLLYSFWLTDIYIYYLVRVMAKYMLIFDVQNSKRESIKAINFQPSAIIEILTKTFNYAFFSWNIFNKTFCVLTQHIKKILQNCWGNTN